VYRVALAVALALVVVALFALGRPGTPKLNDKPVSFDGQRAAADMRSIATQFPQRVAGSDADNRAGIWLVDQFDQLGLETHVQGFPATVGGKDVAMQNVWAIVKGAGPGTILVIANRDTPPLATQGANDNASGVAALLELARASAATAHDRSVIFLATTGDALGALGARKFLEEYGAADDLIAVIALREIATQERSGIGLDGWSTTPKAAPPWLWLLSAPAARVYANDRALLPGVVGQIIHLAAPTSSGSQGPFVDKGIPGITITADGADVAAQNDILDNVSNETLTKVGSAVQSMILTIDSSSLPDAQSGGTIFLTRQRTLPGGALTLILVAFLLPLLAVTVDLFAHCRRERVHLRPAILRAALHLAPWLIVVVIIYFANLIGLLPQSPGAVIPPESPLVDSPRYVHVVLLVALLLVVYVYAVAVERRVERQVATDPRATILVAHLSLVAIALVALLVNPYSALFVLPAAMLWPLARPGGWMRSILPAYLGLVMIPIVLVYFAAQVEVGWNVWWYFLLLVETRTIPVVVVLFGGLFFSTAGMLAHALHERGESAEELGWGAVEPQPRARARRRREPRALSRDRLPRRRHS
jgi:hypothetical protein